MARCRPRARRVRIDQDATMSYESTSDSKYVSLFVSRVMTPHVLMEPLKIVDMRGDVQVLVCAAESGCISPIGRVHGSRRESYINLRRTD